MKGGLGIGVAIATAGVVSCSLFVDTGGLGGGGSTEPAPVDGAAPDASAAPVPTVGDEGGPPPSIDGSTFVPVDAGTDAGAACVGAGWFCDDFEGPLGALWTPPPSQNGGTVSRVTGAKNGSFALQAQVDALAGMNDAYLLRVLPGPPSAMACDFDLKVVDLPSNGEVDVIGFITKSGAGVVQNLYFASFSGAWSVSEFTDKGGGNVIDRGQPLPVGPVVGQWTHVHFATDYQTVSLSLDGGAATTLGQLTPMNVVSRNLELGITYSSGAQPTSLLVDDLVCSMKP